MVKNTAKPIDKPPKPYPEFPLFPHATGRWCKKIRGKFCYFGPWNDPDGALQLYLEQKDELHSGRTPRAKSEGLAVRELCNRYLTSKFRRVESGELNPRTFRDYKDTCATLVNAFGSTRLVDDLTADDFGWLRGKLAKGRGPVSIGNNVQGVRSVFKFGYEAGLIDKPIRFGPEFVKPSRRTLREDRYSKPRKLFTAKQISKLLDVASVQMRAMILLGINAGYGNTDCSKLPLKAIDMETGIVDWPRPKTAIRRRATLWPETIEALEAAVKVRPKHKTEADAGVVFITKYGNKWVRPNPSGSPINSVGLEFAKLLKGLKIKKTGVSFYSLRHTFRTVSDETHDSPAIDRIMGHEPDDMSGRYRERIGDERLKVVTDYVRKWLFSESNSPVKEGSL